MGGRRGPAPQHQARDGHFGAERSRSGTQLPCDTSPRRHVPRSLSQRRGKPGGCGSSEWELALWKAGRRLWWRALGNLALTSAEIWLLTLSDFLAYGVLCYLTRNKSCGLIARLSPSFAVPEAALHQHPSHVLLLSPLLMTLHKCSGRLLGQVLCSAGCSWPCCAGLGWLLHHLPGLLPGCPPAV